MKSTLTLTIVLNVEHDRSVDPYDVVNECTYSFDSCTEGATIVETEIVDVEQVK